MPSGSRRSPSGPARAVRAPSVESLGGEGVTTERGTGITALLAGWKAGDPAAFDRLVELAYPELRRIAHQQLGRRRPGESLESAALASEVYLRLLRAGSLDCENRVHFLALCAQVMRRILVDHARQRAAARPCRCLSTRPQQPSAARTPST